MSKTANEHKVDARKALCLVRDLIETSLRHTRNCDFENAQNEIADAMVVLHEANRALSEAFNAQD